MKQTLKRCAALFTDPFCVQIYFILFSFLVEIPLLMQYMMFWKKVGLVWAAAVIIYDLFARRRFLKMPFAVPAMGLIVAYGITVVCVRMAYPAAFQETYLDWFCSIVTLFVLYPPTAGNSEQGLRRLDVINWLLVALTAVVALISLWMFAARFGGHFYSDITDYSYPIGFYNKRLTGLYRNAIYPTALIGLMAAAVQWTRLAGRAVVRRVLLVLCVLVNWLYIVLTNSRSTVYALVMFCALVAMFLVRHRLAALGGRAWLAGAAVAAAVAVAVCVTAAPVRRLCAQATAPLSTMLSNELVMDVLMSDEQQEELSNVEQPDRETVVDVEREDSDSRGVLTGRPAIWKQGVEYFLQRPVFGYGPYALKDSIKISQTSTERLSHFHNIFLHSLVSVGVVGSVFFFLLIFGAAWLLLRHLLCCTDAEHYRVTAVIGAMLASLVFLNLADTTIFYLSKNSEFVFWSYLGYALLLISPAKLRLDAPARAFDSVCGRVLQKVRRGNAAWQ